MRRTPSHRLAATLLVLLLAGCDDPMRRPGTWQASGIVATDLAIAVVDKRDLVSGQPDGGADGVIAAMAVDRMRQDKIKALNAATTTTISGGGTGASN